MTRPFFVNLQDTADRPKYLNLVSWKNAYMQQVLSDSQAVQSKLGFSDSVACQANLLRKGHLSSLRLAMLLFLSVFTSTYGGRGMPRVVTTSLGISGARWGGLYSEVCFKSSYKSLTMRTDKNLRI